MPRDAALRMVGLDVVMARTRGDPRVRIGLIDGAVARDHPELTEARLVDLGRAVANDDRTSAAAVHGTWVAGILVARRGSSAPAICPGCTLLVHPLFGRSSSSATPDAVADAITACVDAGADVINLSAATGEPSTPAEHRLHRAIDDASRHGTLIAAAAGNRATLGSSPLTRHPWVIPVVSYDRRGMPMGGNTLGQSIGRRGIGAPGDGIESLGIPDGLRVGDGTSAATAFVSNTIALLRSLMPRASASSLRRAVMGSGSRRSVMPPLIDAAAAMGLLHAFEAVAA